MMVATTTFPNIETDQKSKRVYEPRTLQADFGDGYGQGTPDGLNPYSEEWTVSFANRPDADIDTIADFLDLRGGHDPFFWTPPPETPESPVKQWKLKGKYTRSYPGGDNGSITFLIRRVFDL